VRKVSSSSKASKVFSVRLPLDQASDVEDLALARGISPSRLLALMLDDYMNQQARVRFQETLIHFENRQARRDVEIERLLKRFDSRLEKFGDLLQESMSIE